MRISPIQLVNLSFRRVSVEIDVDHMEAPSPEGFDMHGMFDGVLVKTEVSKAPLEQDDRRGKPYFLTLRVLIDNVADEGNPAQKFSPYKVDVEAGGVVILANGAEQIGDPDDLVAVNGPALLWGAVREQVANLTSRMVLGTALLPSVNFHDLKKAEPSQTDAASKATAASGTRASARRARTRTP